MDKKLLGFLYAQKHDYVALLTYNQHITPTANALLQIKSNFYQKNCAKKFVD